MSLPRIPPGNGGTPDAREWRPWHYVLVGAFFFVVYQLSLIGAIDPDELFWRFGADNMIEVFERRDTSIASPKHPLFALLTPPLYSLGRALHGWASEPLATKLALAFPVALFGAINTALVFWILRKSARSPEASLFGLLYGFSATTWIFSSYPDTYVLTALCTSVFVAVLIGRVGDRGYALPAANTLACYASPQQILLAAIPVLERLRIDGLSRKSLSQIARYAAVIAVLFVVPYLVYLEIAGDGWKLAPGYVKAYSDPGRLIDIALYPVVLVNFLVFSVIGPVVHPSFYRDPASGFFAEAPVWWFALAALYLLVVARSLGGVRAASAPVKPLVPSIGIFLAGYSLFFLVFNPGESFIYSFPALLLWILVLQTGFSARPARSWRVLLVVLVLLAVANNAGVLALLSRLT